MKNELIYKCKHCGNCFNPLLQRYCVECGFYIEPTLEEAKMIREKQYAIILGWEDK